MGVASGGLWIGGFWRKPPLLIYGRRQTHGPLGTTGSPMSYSPPSLHFSIPVFDDPLVKPPAVVHERLPIGRESVTYCTSSFVTYLVISLLPPLFFIVFQVCNVDPHSRRHLSHSPPARIDTPTAFSIYLSSSLPPRDFISTLHEGAVCTIVFSIFGDLAQALELQILPLIEKVPSKTVGSHLTRGSEATRNNKVARSTASMNRNMKPTFVVYVDRCCAEIRRRSKQASANIVIAYFAYFAFFVLFSCLLLFVSLFAFLQLFSLIICR